MDAALENGRRKEINLVKILDDKPIKETFQGVETIEGGWQLRNVPGLIEGISFGDVFEEKTEGKRGWKLIKKSAYSTVIVIISQHMQTPHGQRLIEEALSPLLENSRIIHETSGPIHRFAVLPENAQEVMVTLNEGEIKRKFWEWSVFSDRTTSE